MEGTRFIDHPDGSVTYYREEDVEPILKANAAQRAMRSTVEKKGDLHHVMRVPMIVIEDICNKNHLNFWDKDDAKKIMAILKGPEFAFFRTTPGKL